MGVGIIPSSEVFGKLARCDEKGYLAAGEDCATSCPGLYAAGDIRGKKLRQVVTAVAELLPFGAPLLHAAHPGGGSGILSRIPSPKK